MSNLPVTNIAQGLAGRSPGLIVQTSGGGSSGPGLHGVDFGRRHRVVACAAGQGETRRLLGLVVRPLPHGDAEREEGLQEIPRGRIGGSWRVDRPKGGGLAEGLGRGEAPLAECHRPAGGDCRTLPRACDSPHDSPRRGQRDCRQKSPGQGTGNENRGVVRKLNYKWEQGAARPRLVYEMTIC